MDIDALQMVTSARTSEAIGTGFDHRTVESELQWKTNEEDETNCKSDKKRRANNKGWRQKDEAFTNAICEGLLENRRMKGDEWMHTKAEERCKVMGNLLIETVEIQREIEERAPQVNGKTVLRKLIQERTRPDLREHKKM